MRSVPKTGTFSCFNTYGKAPIWSSCPCVRTIPLILSIFFIKYEISGITRSIPSMSSSGKARPQSTIIISLSYSKTVIFFPISCNPPKEITFNFGFFEAKKTPPVFLFYHLSPFRQKRICILIFYVVVIAFKKARGSLKLFVILNY